MAEESAKPSAPTPRRSVKRQTIREFYSREKRVYEPFDKRTEYIHERLKLRKLKSKPTLADIVDAKKPPIERCLEDNDKAFKELYDNGNELIENIKLCNEKREADRRDRVKAERLSLEQEIEMEKEKSKEILENINSYWESLKAIKSPFVLEEQMKKQRERVKELMESKDRLIAKLREDCNKADETYYNQQEFQKADIFFLTQRVNNHLDSLRTMYHQHLQILIDTITEQRELLFEDQRKQFEEILEQSTADDAAREQSKKKTIEHYRKEVRRLMIEHEEMTRATRIRLENNKQELFQQLRDVKAKVLLNSEKLDYNYQVLQKKVDENIIIRNQQKRELSNLYETVNKLRSKVKEMKKNGNNEIRRLTAEVMQLHESIMELEVKADTLADVNNRQFMNVWEMNQTEATGLLQRVLAQDKVLCEQQLGLMWEKPPLDLFHILDMPSYKKAVKRLYPEQYALSKKRWEYLYKRTSEGTIGQRSDSDKFSDLTNTRVIRSIIRQICDRTGFLVEDKIIPLLRKYVDGEKTLVSIDNIFEALGIKDTKDISTLLNYFIPYSYCINCSNGLPQSVLNQFYKIELIPYQDEIENLNEGAETQTLLTENTDMPMTLGTVETLEELKVSNKTPESLENINDDKSSSKEDSEVGSLASNLMQFISEVQKHDYTTFEPQQIKLIEESAKSHQTSYMSAKRECKDHFLTIESAFILTALRDFMTAQRMIKKGTENQVITLSQRLTKDRPTVSRLLRFDDVEKFWARYKQIFPEKKLKLWLSLEFGLMKYLEVLKQREKLDSDCEFLRKQNIELKHLLQQYLPNNPECICD